MTFFVVASWSVHCNAKPMYRTPPSAPTFNATPAPRSSSCIVDVVGQGDPNINIVVIEAGSDLPLMSTYTDEFGDWIGFLILPNGTYTVYVVAINEDDEVSGASYSGPFHVVF